jgi:hypothetical protein
MNTPRFEKTGDADGRIFIGGQCVAEITNMYLCNLRLGPGGGIIIGRDVPLPLFWRQYAHHEDPRRNGGSLPRVNQVAGKAGQLLLRCEGTNAGGEIISQFTVAFSEDRSSGGYALDIHGVLEVAPGKKWSVTHNPSHGELEFCNIWPEGTFQPQGRRKKTYTLCFVQRGDTVTLIPHTHIESSDKQNIVMHRGDRFGWLLEEENPVVELLSDTAASAGLCAYMWDAHIGYRKCHGPVGVVLESGSRHEATIRITRMGYAEGAALMMRGVRADAREAALTPIYIEGINTFRETLLSLPGREQTVWPWTFEVPTGDHASIRGTVDRSRGYDDTCSLRVSSESPGSGRWTATTLGPAFGGPPFADGRRYRLSAVACSSSLKGIARAGLRLHREGTPGLGDTGAYEIYWAEKRISGDTHWTALDVTTPSISPPPDRVHLLLDHEGEGTSWFDNVLFETYE